MLELLFACALVTGFVRAVRLRHGWAIAGACAVAYLLIADELCVFAVRGNGTVFGLFASVFIGPGASPQRALGAVPFPRLLIQHPLLVRVVRSVVCGLVAWICFRQSSRLNPLVQRAYALDGLAMPFAGAGILDALATVVLLWAWAMMGDDAVLVPRGG
jgi:hypothetical protein